MQTNIPGRGDDFPFVSMLVSVKRLQEAANEKEKAKEKEKAGEKAKAKNRSLGRHL